MVFGSHDEVFMAFQHGKVSRHAMIKLRMPRDKRLIGDGAKEYRPGGVVVTSPGRVMFNYILPTDMSYYNRTFGSKQLASVASQQYCKFQTCLNTEQQWDIQYAAPACSQAMPHQ